MRRRRTERTSLIVIATPEDWLGIGQTRMKRTPDAPATSLVDLVPRRDDIRQRLQRVT